MATTAGIKTRHEALGLTREQLLEMYYYVVLARRVDERLWLLNRSGKIPFVISCQGQEAAQVGIVYAMQKGKDFLVPYYRDMGAALCFGMTPRDMMLASMAKQEDPSSGAKQMAHHYGHRAHNIVTGSSPVSTQIPQAAGIALAAKMRGEDAVVYTAFGEGSSNQGDFHEGLNFAGVHKLGCLFVCQNNEYAISVPLEKQVAAKNVADRAIGYGMPGVIVDGSDLLACYAAGKEAVARARRGEGSTLIEARCYRLTPHSSDDDDRTYRGRDEVEQAKKSRDPVHTTRAYLYAAGILDEKTEQAMEARIAGEVDEATEYAQNAPAPRPEDALNHVYGEQ